jgi:hypothetical protein
MVSDEEVAGWGLSIYTKSDPRPSYLMLDFITLMEDSASVGRKIKIALLMN